MDSSSTRDPLEWIDGLSRRMRRVIAVATLVGLPAMSAWSSLWMSTNVSRLLWGPVTFLLIGMTLAGSLILYRSVRDRADLRSAGLDERQRQLRDRAWVLSYQILAVVVVAAVGVVAVAVLGMGRDVRLDAPLVSAAAITVGVLLPILPIAALAWLEPDAPAES
jgi:hypothetical protein